MTTLRKRLGSWLPGFSKGNSKTRLQTAHLRLECLEDRTVCDAGARGWLKLAAHHLAPHKAPTSLRVELPKDQLPQMDTASSSASSGGTLAARVVDRGLFQSHLAIGSHYLDYFSDQDYAKYIKWLVVSPENRSTQAFKHNDVAFMRQNLEDPLRKQIFVAMDQNPRVDFWFATLEHAKENFFMRVATVNFMLGIEKDTVDVQFLPGADPNTESSFWQHDDNAQDHWPVETRPGKKSHAAIVDLLRYEFDTDCLGGVEIALLQAADRAMGSKQFDRIHRGGLHGIGMAGSDPNQICVIRHAIDFLQSRPSSLISTDDMVPGDWVYMTNKADYNTDLVDPSSPGYWRGENVIYTGQYDVNGSTISNQTFSAYNPSAPARFSGLGIQSATEGQLRTELRTQYNNLMKPPFTHTTHASPTDQEIYWYQVVRVGTGLRLKDGSPAEAVF